MIALEVLSDLVRGRAVRAAVVAPGRTGPRPHPQRGSVEYARTHLARPARRRRTATVAPTTPIP